MALNNYDGLRASIADHLDREDLVGQVDDFIQLAEAGLRRDIRTRDMLVRAQFDIDDRHEPTPERFLETLAFRTNSDTWRLEYVVPQEFDKYIRNTTGRPRCFTVYGNEFEFDVTPDQTYSPTLVYYRSDVPLSEIDPVNDTLLNHPDLYLYGSLTASAPFLMNDERIATWAGLYSAAVEAVNARERNARRVGRLVSRVGGKIY